MREGRAAQTAQIVAFARAIETRRPASERLFADPFAGRFLGTDGRWVIDRLERRAVRAILLRWIDAITPGLLAYALGRTAFIDDAIVAGLRGGMKQILILGAGYDTRALRIPGIEHATVFEVDHPDTQAVKRDRLGRDADEIRERLRFVSVDFERQDLRERLASSSFDFDQPTFVIWEGVTQYLEAGAVDATLAALAQMAADTEVVFTYADRRFLEGTRSFPGGRRILYGARFFGEPFRFGLVPSDVAPYLLDRGFELLEDVGGGDFSSRYFEPRGRRDRATETERVARASRR